MAKGKVTAYFCKECGYESAKWMGQCPGCREWNTFVEELVSKDKKSKSSLHTDKKPSLLSQIPTEDEERTRQSSWRRNCKGVFDFNGRGPGNWKIDVTFTGLQADF